MIDIGGWVHHMTHSAATDYDVDGITYNQTYSFLQSQSSARYQFPADFFLSIDVKPFTPAAPPQNLLIFSKRLAGSLT